MATEHIPISEHNQQSIDITELVSGSTNIHKDKGQELLELVGDAIESVSPKVDREIKNIHDLHNSLITPDSFRILSLLVTIFMVIVGIYHIVGPGRFSGVFYLVGAASIYRFPDIVDSLFTVPSNANSKTKLVTELVETPVTSDLDDLGITFTIIIISVLLFILVSYYFYQRYNMSDVDFTGSSLLNDSFTSSPPKNNEILLSKNTNSSIDEKLTSEIKTEKNKRKIVID